VEVQVEDVAAVLVLACVREDGQTLPKAVGERSVPRRRWTLRRNLFMTIVEQIGWSFNAPCGAEIDRVPPLRFGISNVEYF
jgi:hypothetical protein